MTLGYSNEEDKDENEAPDEEEKGHKILGVKEIKNCLVLALLLFWKFLYKIQIPNFFFVIIFGGCIAVFGFRRPLSKE